MSARLARSRAGLALVGAREHAKRLGFQVVYDKTFPPTTVDHTPIVRAIKALNPDIVFVATYPANSSGMLNAAQEVGLEPKLFGGGMVGLHFTSLLTKLGPKLNGIVDYGFWVPEPTMKFSGIDAFLAKYQPAAVKAGVDPLGFYLPPFAYAMMQVLGQAVNGANSLKDDVLAAYIRKTTFNTIHGPIKFGANGEWEKGRMLQVQYHSIKRGDGIDVFRGMSYQSVLTPAEYKTGTVIYPYEKAK